MCIRDSDYRGEICIILVNLSSEDFMIEDGERIAQMVVARHEHAEWQEVEAVSYTHLDVYKRQVFQEQYLPLPVRL